MYCTIYNNDNPYVEIYSIPFQLGRKSNINIKIENDSHQFIFNDYLADIIDYKDEKRFNSNIRRIVRTTFDLCAMNKFDYFMTVTINGKKHNRADLESLYSSLSKYFDNYKQRKSKYFKYLCLPELHADKQNYHFHCLVSGVSNNDLIDFSELEHIPKKIKLKLFNGENVFMWQGIEDSFGFNSLIYTYGSQENIAKYMTKYISKNIYMQKNFCNIKLLRHSSKLVKPIKKYIPLNFNAENYKVYDTEYGFISRLPLETFNYLQNSF